MIGHDQLIIGCTHTPVGSDCLTLNMTPDFGRIHTYLITPETMVTLQTRSPGTHAAKQDQTEPSPENQIVDLYNTIKSLI